MKKSVAILLVLLSALLFALPWCGITSLTTLVAFVPLLFIQQRLKGRRFTLYATLAFIVFNLIGISWVGKAAPIGVAAATLTFIVLFGVVVWLYNYIWKRAPKSLSYTILVSCWVAAEYLYLNGEISFPWLNLGNSFSIDYKLVQWYEYSGALGGTMWVLISNLVVFEALSGYFATKHFEIKRWVAPAVIIVVPIVVSLIIYYNYQEKTEPIEVSVLQPNIDPYTDKFGGMTQKEQAEVLLSLAQEAPATTSYLIAPETALDDGFFIETLSTNRSIDTLQRFMRHYHPKAAFILGLTTYSHYPKEEGKEPPTVTARTNDDINYYYDVYNSAIQIDSTLLTPLYHKSNLVIGVEMLPYHEYLGFINKLSVSLGGISGMLGSQDSSSNFTSTEGIVSGTAICYEGIYGEYFASYVKNGARIMFIITNDGWWGNTLGYRQNFSFARLRAIETRRSIARSANTGISAFINQRGDAIQTLGWDVRGVITQTLNLNSATTTYVKYGDMVGRLCSYVLALSLLYYIGYRRRKKDYLVD